VKTDKGNAPRAGVKASQPRPAELVNGGRRLRSRHGEFTMAARLQKECLVTRRVDFGGLCRGCWAAISSPVKLKVPPDSGELR
jgi:hypothetical protein